MPGEHQFFIGFNGASPGTLTTHKESKDKMAKQQRKKSEADKSMLEAVGDVIVGDSPGATAFHNIEFEGLGKLIDFPRAAGEEDTEEGTGEWCTVEADYMTGADGVGYKRGDVRRLSKFVQGYSDMTDSTKDAVREEIRRLMEVGAFRIAAPDEQGAGSVDLGPRFVSHEVTSERSRRIKAERELEELRRGISNQAQSIDEDDWDTEDSGDETEADK